MKGWKAWQWIALWLFIYLITWAAAALAPGKSEPKLVSLLAWGGAYFACAIFIAHSATVRIRETVEHDIIPYANDKYGREVAADLRTRYPAGSLLLPSIPIGLLAGAAAWAAIAREIERPAGTMGLVASPEFRFWAASYFVYFLIAAIVVNAARFYSSFADKLPSARPRFHVLGASDTPLIRGLSKLGGQVLAFWAAIFALVLTSMLLAIVPPGDYRLARGSLLLFLMVPIAGFFSLGFGTLVYLGYEARIRATLQRFTHGQAAKLQQAINALIRPSEKRWLEDPGRKDELESLVEWQDRILAGGKYGSRAGEVLSIALPLSLPLLSLTLKLLGWL